MEEIVANHRTGLHFNPGDAGDLAQKAAWAWFHAGDLAEMGRAARLEYERRYTAEENYAELLKIYERVLGRQAANPRPAGDTGPIPVFASR